MLFCVLLAATSFAQPIFIQDINGRPIFENTYSDVEGSPYLQPDWMRGTVKAKHNGKTYQLAKMKYDAYKDEVEYEENQKLYRFSKEITEFSTPSGLFRNGFSSIESFTPQSFYEVLHDGNLKLLKKHFIRIVTEKPYNSATETKRFTKEETLFLWKDNKMYRLKKDKKAILELLGSKQPEIEAFIKEQKLKLSKEEDILKVVEKFETL